MFASASLAARIDRAEAGYCASAATIAGTKRPNDRILTSPLAGGQAIYAGPHAPINKIIGIGFDGPVDPASLTEVEEQWRERGEDVRVELSSLAHPEVALALSQRGYQLHGFENVLAHDLRNTEDPAILPGLSIEVVSDGTLSTWTDIAVASFLNLDGSGSAAEEKFATEELQRALEDTALVEGSTRYLAYWSGHPVGMASLALRNGIALFGGSGTLPAFRGRGVQKALVQTRLTAARAAGCNLAVVTTGPGTRSQENVLRRGFALLYNRAVLVKHWA
jgi:GNAT superfamily N-acetyltransferase